MNAMQANIAAASIPRYTWSWQQQAYVEDKMMPPSMNIMGAPGSPSLKRRDGEDSNSPLLDKKNKIKKMGSKDSPGMQRKAKFDDKSSKRVRESYACLRHRAMHKRCPADCPDRRIPKPLPVAQERRAVQQQQMLQQQQQQQQKLLKTAAINTANSLLLQNLQQHQQQQQAVAAAAAQLHHSASSSASPSSSVGPLHKVTSGSAPSNSNNPGGDGTTGGFMSYNPPIMGLESLPVWDANALGWDATAAHSWNEHKLDSWDEMSTGSHGGNPAVSAGGPGTSWEDSKNNSQKSSEDEFFSSAENLVDYWLDPNASFSTLPNPYNWGDPTNYVMEMTHGGGSWNPDQQQLQQRKALDVQDVTASVNAATSGMVEPIATSGNDIMAMDTNTTKQSQSQQQGLTQTPLDTSTPKELLYKILLSRDTLERWVSDQYFNKLLSGFYIRVRVGETNGTPVHRIGCIIEGRDQCYELYRLGRAETTKGFVVHFGSYGQHIVSLAAVSNKPPTENEYNEWKQDMDKVSQKVTPQDVLDKVDIASVLNMKHQAFASH